MQGRHQEHRGKVALNRLHAPRARTLLLGTVALLATLLALSTGTALAGTTHPYLSSFDGSELMEGGFQLPSGLAIDQTKHDLYVVDRDGAAGGTGAVDVFSETGKLETQITGAEVPGQSLKLPTYLAVDNSGGATDGRIYVGSNNIAAASVYAFDATGKFLFEITAADTPSKTLELEGIATDASGNIYVSNQGIPHSASSTASAIDEFSSQGKFISQISGPALNSPTHGAINAEGDIYARVVIETPPGTYGYEIAEFEPTGALLRTIDTNEPTAVTVDPATQNVYVAHQSYV